MKKSIVVLAVVFLAMVVAVAFSTVALAQDPVVVRLNDPAYGSDIITIKRYLKSNGNWENQINTYNTDEIPSKNNPCWYKAAEMDDSNTYLVSGTTNMRYPLNSQRLFSFYATNENPVFDYYVEGSANAVNVFFAAIGGTGVTATYVISPAPYIINGKEAVLLWSRTDQGFLLLANDGSMKRASTIRAIVAADLFGN